MSSDGDFSVILSSGMIAEIVEDYMNRKMYKKPVCIVDLQPTQQGYMFVVAFRDARKEVDHTDTGGTTASEAANSVTSDSTHESQVQIDHMLTRIAAQRETYDPAPGLVAQILEAAGPLSMFTNGIELDTDMEGT